MYKHGASRELCKAARKLYIGCDGEISSLLQKCHANLLQKRLKVSVIITSIIVLNLMCIYALNGFFSLSGIESSICLSLLAIPAQIYAAECLLSLFVM